VAKLADLSRRVWWASSFGNQVLILASGGELDTAFVLPGIFSDDNPRRLPHQKWE